MYALYDYSLFISQIFKRLMIFCRSSNIEVFTNQIFGLHEPNQLIHSFQLIKNKFL